MIWPFKNSDWICRWFDHLPTLLRELNLHDTRLVSTDWRGTRIDTTAINTCLFGSLILNMTSIFFSKKRKEENAHKIELYPFWKWTDYGHPESFFSKIPNFWAWADKSGPTFFGNLGYFQQNYKHPFWYCKSLVHVSINQPLFFQKTKPLYSNPKYLFEFGPQSHRVFVVRVKEHFYFLFDKIDSLISRFTVQYNSPVWWYAGIAILQTPSMCKHSPFFLK